ncbi:MAG: phosphoenolpyruvate--protein phosphotransferase [Candidatus Syntrophosphaera sp.]
MGLFRTEYLFMRNVLPTEEEQAETYQYISQIIYPKELVIRTADLGGDKFISHFEVPKEMNPFLGLRGIRLCLEYKDFFKTQLKAILRASKLKNVRIMFPMISGVDELRQARQVLEEAKDELKERGTEFDEEIKVGIMIEVPSAAMISDILATEVDFFSIGTNDLIQYTLAVDRVNEKISYLYNPIHPAILRLIKMVVNNGHQNNIPVAMCGQMAGMAEYALLLIGMDLDVLSVAPANLLEMKKIIRAVEYEKCKQIVQSSIQYNDVHVIREHFQRYNKELLSGVLFNYGKEGDDE